MPRQRSWNSLIPGIVALGALIASAAAVLLFARVGAMRGRTVRIYAAVTQAAGLVGGSDVWLLGEKIGTVGEVSFLPPSMDTTRRILVTLDVLERSLPFMRRGAAVDIQPGGNLIGAPVASIRPGTVGQPPIRSGDTLPAVPGNREFRRARADFAIATQGLPIVIRNVRLLTSQLQGARGTLGALGIGGTERLGVVAGSASRMLTAATAGNGTLGRAMRGGDAAKHAREALARIDSLRALVIDATVVSPLGRFRRDSTLPATIASLRAELATVARQLEESRGTAGRLQHDSALTSQVAAGRRELAALAADVKRNPLRYLVF